MNQRIIYGNSTTVSIPRYERRPTVDLRAIVRRIIDTRATNMGMLVYLQGKLSASKGLELWEMLLEKGNEKGVIGRN